MDERRCFFPVNIAVRELYTDVKTKHVTKNRFLADGITLQVKTKSISLGMKEQGNLNV